MGPTLYIELYIQIDPATCKLNIKLYVISTGIIDNLNNSIKLIDIDYNNIKFITKNKNLYES